MVTQQRPASGPASSVVVGFALASCGVLMLPVGDAIAKYLSGHDLHPVQIAWGAGWRISFC